MFVLTRLRPPPSEVEALERHAEALLAALAVRPGYLGGELGRSTEDSHTFGLLTRWDGVGSYRRALSAAEVKIAGAPVWVFAVDEPGAFVTD